MHILEKQSTKSITSFIGSNHVKVVIVDGVAEVQSLDNPDWTQTVKFDAFFFLLVFIFLDFHLHLFFLYICIKIIM